MKISPWLIGGAVALLIVGLAGLTMGIFLTGSLAPAEAPGGGGKSATEELKQKSESTKIKLGQLSDKQRPGLGGLKDHRVFVSRSIVFLPQEAEHVQPLDPEQITEDGIKVGWKLKYGFSPEDREVASQDEDQDGFTNKEEYEKGTDPRNTADSPSKWVKVKILSVEPAMMTVAFSGKSSDRYTLRFKLGAKKPTDVDVMVGDKLWVVATSKGIDVFKGLEEANKSGEKSSCTHIIPLEVKAFKNDKGKRMDEKTKTENEYDDSMLLLERKDELMGPIKILLDERGKSRGVSWNVGDVRLVSLVPGEGEMGPFRVGQSFPYAEKVFVLTEATPTKVSLKMKPEGESVDILPKSP